MLTEKNVFIHHVFFWLKNPENKEEKNQLIEGLKKLSSASTIQDCHIGVPADTHRNVVERSYSVSWMVFFENPADQETYQSDPVHLQFIERCSHLWSKVLVYDSITATGS